MVVIQTPRLTLRRFQPGDLDALASILGDEQVMRFSVKGPRDRHESGQWLERVIGGYERSNGLGFLAVVGNGDAGLMGFCGPLPQTVDGIEEVEIGYRLHPDFWGRGLGTEAARAARDYAFEQLGCVRLISIIEAENVASIRVAEKNGMRLDRETVAFGLPVRIYAISATDHRPPVDDGGRVDR